jgi:hypothetical protein
MIEYKHTISCIVCGRPKQTNKLKTKYCSNACRQSMYRSGVTNDTELLRNYVDSLRKTASKQYAILLVELAKIRNKDNTWIKHKLEIHEKTLISDAHHGYNEAEGIHELEENINLFNTRKKSINNSK